MITIFKFTILYKSNHYQCYFSAQHYHLFLLLSSRLSPLHFHLCLNNQPATPPNYLDLSFILPKKDLCLQYLDRNLLLALQKYYGAELTEQRENFRHLMILLMKVLMRCRGALGEKLPLTSNQDFQVLGKGIGHLQF